MMLILGWGIFLAANLFAFALYGLDKRKAKRGDWRIPERTLLLSAWLLGGAGAWLGMQTFRHKTKHLRFVIGVPLAAVFSLALMVLFTVKVIRL